MAFRRGFNSAKIRNGLKDGADIIKTRGVLPGKMMGFTFLEREKIIHEKRGETPKNKTAGRSVNLRK